MMINFVHVLQFRFF